MCRQKDAKTVQGCALKTRSPCCAGYGFRFFGHEKSKSVLHADGLKKSLRRIFIAAALERRTANHHPCPLLGGGGLGGGKANTLRSAAWLSASPNTPRVLLSVYSCQPIRAPFPPSGKGVGGKGRYARGYLGSDSVRSTDCFSAPAANQSVSSTASDRGLGAEPQACFGSFYTSKRNATAASRTN